MRGFSKMNIRSNISSALMGALFLGVGSLAAQASTYWSTGVDGNSDGKDDHYTVLGSIANNATNSNAGYPAVGLPPVTTPASGPAYLYSNGAYPAGLNFISNDPFGGVGLNTTVYAVTFFLDVAGLISGNWAADNGGVIYNGNTQVAFLGTELNGPATNYSSSHPFSFFGNAGLNTLTFYITDGGPPSAFAFNVESVSVPGPIVGAGLPGLVVALGGLVVLARRRRNQAVIG
jgi:hypothetical protein